jgi:Tfp pilus assembly protein PilN
MTAEVATTALAPVTSVDQARVPRVNLLPPEIAEQKAFRRIQAGLLVVVLLAAAATGALWEHQRSSTADARTAEQTSAARTTALQARVAHLSYVTAVYGAVSNARAMLEQALGQEILWSHYLTDLGLVVPSGVWLTSVTATETPTTGTSSSSSATSTSPPGTTSALGSVTFVGVALTRDDVASWLQAIDTEKGFGGAFVSSITEDKIGSTIVYDFDSTVNLTSKAISHRAATLLGANQ